MNFRVCQLLCLVLSTCAFSVLAEDRYTPRRSKVIYTEVPPEIYVAVMGEIRNPGTYHLDSKSLDIHSVVERAGGLKSGASGTIRVVRRGRATQKEIYSEMKSSPIFSGDLLIVDSNAARASVGMVQEFTEQPPTVHAIYEERDVHELVQVAVVNALDYPVILQLRPEEANFGHIVVEKLRQPTDLLAESEVIPPDVFPRSSSDAAKHAIRLAGSSVILFDVGRVNRNRLPRTLPKPIESEIAIGAKSSWVGSSEGQATEFRRLGDKLLASNMDPLGNTAPVSRGLAPESRISLPPVFIERDEERNNSHLPAPNLTNRSPIATVPFRGFPQITSSSVTQSGPSPVNSQSIPSPNDSQDEGVASSSDVDPSQSIDDPSMSTPESHSYRHLAIIFVIVGALIGAALLVRRTLEISSVPRPAFPVTIPATDSPVAVAVTAVASSAQKPLLEKLIGNELPIVFEGVEFPSGLSLQGRIVARPVLRVDGPHEASHPSGPHFKAPANEPSRHQVTMQLDLPESPVVRRPHFMNADSQKRASVTAEADVAAASAVSNRMATSSKAPLAKALFELEQGGIS